MGGHYVNWNHPLASCQIRLSGHDARSGGGEGAEKIRDGFHPSENFLFPNGVALRGKKNAFKPGPMLAATARNERNLSNAGQ